MRERWALGMNRTETDLEKRAKDIRRLREEGWTLQRIGDFYGISRERVRKILIKTDGPVVYDRVCVRCGSDFQTTHINKIYCKHCHCLTCGKIIPAYARSTTMYCSPKCKPGYSDRRGGQTFRAVERGIYVRIYKKSGARATIMYYVLGKDGDRKKWYTFTTKKEARKFQRNKNRQ